MKREKLDSWKEISQYLGKSVTTVQRWERHAGLPVHRVPYRLRGAVFAYKDEIDDWLLTRAEPPNEDSASLARWDKPGRSLRWGLLVATAGVLAVALGAFWLAPKPVPSSLPAAPELRSLTFYPGVEQHASLSPDGRFLAFAWDQGGDNFDIFVRKLPDGNPKRLTEAPGREGSPRWSPDGKKIAYTRFEEPMRRTIVVMNLDTGDEQVVTTVERSRRQGIFAEWTPDGEALLVSRRSSPDAPLRVERLAVDGSVQSPLTNPPIDWYGDFFGVLSPTGKKLAYARCRHEEGSCELRVKVLQTGADLRVARDNDEIWGISWTEHERLVFSSNRTGPYNLWTLDSDQPDQEPNLVLRLFGRLLHPTIGAGMLLFERIDYDDNVWSAELNAKSIPRRETDVSGSEDRPQISPDGTMLAYRSNASGLPEVWITMIEDGRRRQVNGLSEGQVCATDWSPDSRKLLVSDCRSVYVADAHAGRIERRLETGGEASNPFWSRDGRWIYYRMRGSNGTELWKQPSRGAKPIHVLSGEVYEATEGPTGEWIYFTRATHYPHELWRVPAGGGNPELFLTGVRTAGWSFGRKGLYFLDFRDGARSRHTPRDVLLMDMETGELSTVYRIAPEGVRNLLAGFDVTWDGSRIFWSQRDRLNCDIVAIPWVEDGKGRREEVETLTPRRGA